MDDNVIIDTVIIIVRKARLMLMLIKTKMKILMLL